MVWYLPSAYAGNLIPFVTVDNIFIVINMNSIYGGKLFTTPLSSYKNQKD